MSKKIDNKVVLDAAVYIAERDGFLSITRQVVAEQAKVSTAKVSLAFGTMKQLNRAVMRHAIEHEMLPIIATGLGINDRCAMKANGELKRKALDSLL